MITDISDSNSNYNRKLVLSNWQFSATALGLIRFFTFADIEYEIQEEDILLYNYEDINLNCEGLYIDFVEEYFGDRLYPIELHKLLKRDSSENEEAKKHEEKFIMDLMKKNTVLGRVFKGYKFHDNTKEELLTVYEANREELIKGTYKYALNFGYRKFLNENLMGSEKGSVSRLVGYSIDKGRKVESMSFNWDAKSFSSEDAAEFDYIPFAFTKSKEAFFINNNYNLYGLKSINDKLNGLVEELEVEKVKPRKELFLNMGFGSEVAMNNVEIIKKDPGKDYYETIYFRETASKIFKGVNSIISNEKKIMIDSGFAGDDNRTSLQKALDSYVKSLDSVLMDEVTDRILNNLYLDDLIETLLKENNDFLVRNLIKINKIIYKEVNGLESTEMKGAYASAKEIVKKLNTKDRRNKITSYRQKLISCLIMHDYDRFNETLLQLSSYAGVEIGFAYDLFENFEENKNVAYTFVNSLNNFREERKQTNEGEN